MRRTLRDDFSLAAKRVLAHRVGLLCSNPSCRTPTSGPQTNPSKSVNVGVAAHIAGAAAGGPRYDANMLEKERKSPINGIWLCQNCAKLIDSDLPEYPASLLQDWKSLAEDEARSKLGKSNDKTAPRSVRQAVLALQRNHKLRDELYRDLLKCPSERMKLPRGASRVTKLAHSEIIVHRIDDQSYPDIDENPGISGWFKLEVFDFYHNGLQCILNIQCAIVDSNTRNWSLISHNRCKSSFSTRFSISSVYVTGRIPWRNILYYDMRGDQYYPQPHFYCAFADNGEPYEGRDYFLVSGNSYEYELQLSDQMELRCLLQMGNN